VRGRVARCSTDSVCSGGGLSPVDGAGFLHRSVLLVRLSVVSTMSNWFEPLAIYTQSSESASIETPATGDAELGSAGCWGWRSLTWTVNRRPLRCWWRAAAVLAAVVEGRRRLSVSTCSCRRSSWYSSSNAAAWRSPRWVSCLHAVCRWTAAACLSVPGTLTLTMTPKTNPNPIRKPQAKHKHLGHSKNLPIDWSIDS